MEELETVLQSDILKRAPNLQQFLRYVAERYFAGATDQVKEYSIAVKALNRSEQFDPQSDTIVRVTAHALRKKLEQYYATEGLDHPIHIRVPSGKYVLEFEHIPQEEKLEEAPLELEPELDALPLKPPPAARNMRRIWAACGTVAILAAVLFGVRIYRHKSASADAKPEAQASNAPSVADAAAGVGPESTYRFRLGADPHPYVDVAGQTWAADQFCKGGTTFNHADHQIQGTDDQALFQQGREGQFQCQFRVPPGNYEILLLFADTAGDKEGVRYVDYNISNVVATAMDIVDEGGGNDIVVGKVYPGIHPLADGNIHLNFTSDSSYLNAVEITPSKTGAVLPIRMLAGPAVLRDDQGNTWFPDRFFQGGRRAFHPDTLPSGPNARLFAWERYGHFHYLIPVVDGKEYRIRFYFSEEWFGRSNGGQGGIGSRVFDVYCNGTTLLKDFDIMKEQKDGATVMTLDRVKPTAHDMIDLEFSPIRNYPLFNAIEIVPEG